MTYSVYILFSEKLNKYYIGQTENIEVRLNNHNEGLSDFTRRGIPWRLVYVENYSTRAEAQARELQIKNKKSRKYIEFLISTSGL